MFFLLGVHPRFIRDYLIMKFDVFFYLEYVQGITIFYLQISLLVLNYYQMKEYFKQLAEKDEDLTPINAAIYYSTEALTVKNTSFQ